MCKSWAGVLESVWIFFFWLSLFWLLLHLRSHQKLSMVIPFWKTEFIIICQKYVIYEWSKYEFSLICNMEKYTGEETSWGICFLLSQWRGERKGRISQGCLSELMCWTSAASEDLESILLSCCSKYSSSTWCACVIQSFCLISSKKRSYLSWIFFQLVQQ